MRRKMPKKKKKTAFIIWLKDFSLISAECTVCTNGDRRDNSAPPFLSKLLSKNTRHQAEKQCSDFRFRVHRSIFLMRMVRFQGPVSSVRGCLSDDASFANWNPPPLLTDTYKAAGRSSQLMEKSSSSQPVSLYEALEMEKMESNWKFQDQSLLHANNFSLFMCLFGSMLTVMSTAATPLKLVHLKNKIQLQWFHNVNQK